MIQNTLAKIFGTKHDRDIKRIQPLVAQINSWESKFTALSDADLKGKTPEFKQRIQNGESLDALLPEAFAACREAGKRALGMRHYDVQMIGGIVLHRGTISEMRTGEGKTLVATLPVYLNALSGRGVHVVTVNDYLAKRDCEWMGQLYHYMGLTTGTIVHDLSDRERQQNYGADITYGTNNEFGFDYLRDNMKFDLKHYVQRELNFAIVDECDSILIDEARTPLIISGPAEESTELYYQINKVIPHLKVDQHFTMEEKSRTVSLTDEGNTKCEELLNITNIYEPQHIGVMHHIYQGLKAHHLFKRDVDYMVKDGEVVIVDEFTGRLMPGRSWSDGLHQAIEAKENLKVKRENQTLASITFQNYFRMYKKMSGMTGTADTEAVEFKKIYNLDVIVIPTNKTIRRLDEEDVVYKTEKAKYKAITQDIIDRQKKGQPVLVGTVSIEKSERLSRFLRDNGLTHNVLNAKHHEKEAEIVAQAGRYGGVTIATNMAGRGTDILLGGNPEFLAKSELGQNYDETRFAETLKKFQKHCEDEKRKVIEAGGLYIIGTERHESRRIDNQLRGRSGRQGDPGASRFYLSLEDNLMRIFNGERIQRIMTTLKVPEDEPITAGMVTRAIEGAQRKVEGHNFDIRKHLLEYDNVMNTQRTAIYSWRRKVLAGEDLDRLVLDTLGEVTSEILDRYSSEGRKPNEWDLEGMNTALAAQFGLRIDFTTAGEMNVDKLNSVVGQAVKEVFEIKMKYFGAEHAPNVKRFLLLQTIDSKWREHLQRIDHLKEGINLRAYAQRDPLIEYKKEAFIAFEEMNSQIKSEFIEKLLKIQLAPGNTMDMNLEEPDYNEMEFAGAEESDGQSFFAQQPQRSNPAASSGGRPMPLGAMRPTGPQADDMNMSRGDDEDRGYNRAQRRMQKKKKNKIKI